MWYCGFFHDIVASFMILELSRKCGIVDFFHDFRTVPQVWYCGFFHDFRTVRQVWYCVMILELSRMCGIVASFMILELFAGVVLWLLSSVVLWLLSWF